VCLLTLGLVLLVVMELESNHPARFLQRAMLWAMVALSGVTATCQYWSQVRTCTKSRDRIEELTFVDVLTGLYNNRYLDAALAVEVARTIRHGRDLSLAYIDLDNFKPINDRLGHTVGDQVLAGMAEVIKNSARKNDIVARVGGDEFVMVLPETPLVGARVVADRVCEHVAGYSLEVSPEERVDGARCSIGLAEYAGKDMTPRQFVAAADEAMYRAKRAGGHCVVAASDE